MEFGGGLFTGRSVTHYSLDTSLRNLTGERLLHGGEQQVWRLFGKKNIIFSSSFCCFDLDEQ
ncbi:hypothetical protein HanHA300_Chr15g0577201 [Helianthus annuus]|nr:hypothetical protein HanHA300_Chr15g0577201 [Helianthus annuus]KAJ0457107.1 hypothetical protein HanIR_Chr15g0770071 [Helianthus annuus]KAJ0474183.1 hypothetical protein HanHA89_Chr15g0626821 [Helianthus annuus]KAJ0649751.1 hypothetical protein HanLR1_Chr15g0587871 [Helianthus annuus]KAJ0653535.1 hypothetical protein HanOQP8_Chr15g0584661 [Helianthus annuus]